LDRYSSGEIRDKVDFAALGGRFEQAVDQSFDTGL
jgi:hypothetical protein